MCVCEVPHNMFSNDFLHSSLIQFFFIQFNSSSLLVEHTNLMLFSKIIYFITMFYFTIFYYKQCLNLKLLAGFLAQAFNS